MTKLRIAPALFDAFPDVLVGVVAFQGVLNAGESAELMELLREEEDAAVRRLGEAGTPIPEHPHIAPWREGVVECQKLNRVASTPANRPASADLTHLLP